MKKNIRPYLDHHPKIDATCYIDDLSVVIGEVSLAENVSVWPFAVIRGDVNYIKIGKNSNVQDHAMLHVSHKNCPPRPKRPTSARHRLGHHDLWRASRLGRGLCHHGPVARARGQLL